MPILNPKKLLPTGTQQLVNYDFLDVSTGAGYINYYGGYASGGYILSNLPYYSDKVSTLGGNYMDAVMTQKLDLDFDLKINKPLDVSGKMIVNVPCSLVGVNASSGDCESIVIAKLRKVIGSTETEIATEQALTWACTNAGAGVTKEKAILVPITVPATHYAEGDILRVTIVTLGRITNTGTGEGTNGMAIGHDPMNRLGVPGETTYFTSGATIFNVQVPIKIDI